MKTEYFLAVALVLIAVFASASFAADAANKTTIKVSAKASKAPTTKTNTTKPTTTMTIEQWKILQRRRRRASCYVTCFGSERDLPCDQNKQIMKCMICRMYFNCFKPRFIGHAVA